MYYKEWFMAWKGEEDEKLDIVTHQRDFLKKVPKGNKTIENSLAWLCNRNLYFFDVDLPLASDPLAIMFSKRWKIYGSIVQNGAR